MIAAKDQSVITILNDTYTENVAQVTSSVMMLERVTLQMVNSSVLKTFSATSAAIYGTKCNVKMIASTFAWNTGHGILMLVESEMLHLMRCNFTENSVTFNHFLFVSGGKVWVQRSFFSKNINKQSGFTGAFMFAENSSVIVADSYFYRNTNGITCGHGNLTVERNVFEDTEINIIGMKFSNTTVFQSSFIGNDGTIADFKHIFVAGTVSIKGCVFSNLTVQSIISVLNSDVSIHDCVFEGNTGDRVIGMSNGGILSIEYSSLKNNLVQVFVGAHKSKFKFQRLVLENNTTPTILNIMDSTGTASGLDVSRCHVSSSSCEYLMKLDNNSHVDIHDSTFSHNLNIMSISQRSTSSFTNCIFLQNRCSAVGCENLVEVTGGSKIFFHFCQFKKNGHLKKECTMLYSLSSEIVIEQSEFIQNTALALIYSYYESTIEVRNSKFALNMDLRGIHFSFTESHVFTKNNTFFSSLKSQQHRIQAIFNLLKSSIVFQISSFNFTFPSTFISVAIMNVEGGELILDQCKVMANSNGTTFDSDAGQLIFLTVYLQLSNTLMKTAFTTFSGVLLQFKRRSQITFDESLTDYFSWKTSFVDLSSSTYINSTDNPDFLQDAASNNFILSGKQNVHQQETVFASGL